LTATERENAIANLPVEGMFWRRVADEDMGAMVRHMAGCRINCVSPANSRATHRFLPSALCRRHTQAC